MYPKNRFKAKQVKVKTKEDEELDRKIEGLEVAIEGLIKLEQTPPDVMLKELSQLKAKRSPNKYNAHKIIYNGIEFDSTREAKFAKALDEAGVKYDYQVNIEIQEKFELQQEKIQDIELRIDFIVATDWLVDVKGHIQPTFSIKWKMLKYRYRDTRKYFLLQKDSDIDSFIKLIKLSQWKEDTLNL